MNSFSNILTIPQFSNYYKQFMNKLVIKYKQLEPKTDLPQFPSINEEKEPKADAKPLQRDNRSILYPIISPNEYDLKKYNEVTPEDKRFLLEVNVMDIYPKPVYNAVNVLCQSCKHCSLISEIEYNSLKYKCEKCKAEGQLNFKLHFNVTLLCREGAFANDIITLHVCSYDEEGGNLFGLPPADAYRNSTEFQRIGDAFKRITNPSAYITVLVEQYGNTVFRIVGKYDHAM